MASSCGVMTRLLIFKCFRQIIIAVCSSFNIAFAKIALIVSFLCTFRPFSCCRHHPRQIIEFSDKFYSTKTLFLIKLCMCLTVTTWAQCCKLVLLTWFLKNCFFSLRQSFTFLVFIHSRKVTSYHFWNRNIILIPLCVFVCLLKYIVSLQ